MNYDERREIYRLALAKWGADAQTKMAIEEMSELTKEICKIYRGKADLDGLAEEIADVTIMLEQLRLIYGVDADVDIWIDAKIKRLEGRL